MDINIRICGEAGQGVQTVGNLLARTFRAIGLHVFATQSYMSRIRGGVNSSDVRISDRELHSPRENAEIIVALASESLEAYRETLAPGGVIVFDGDAACENEICINLADAAKQAGGTKQMVNSVAAGAVMELLGYSGEKLYGLLQRQFASKGKEVADANVASAKTGAVAVADRKEIVKGPQQAKKPVGELAGGGEAIALSAATSGVKVVSCYPMSPSTEIFESMASMADIYGIVVEQAEDEICAVNLVCGATYAGVPAMTATSGGGFALMVEGLALSGMLELPVFIVLGMRPGPATGLPTRTGQEELEFAIRAGHGEFPRAVYAPGSIPQAYSLTRRALQTAHKYQTPVIMLTDQFIMDLQKTVSPLSATYSPINRQIVEDAGADYERYKLTDSGISPRAIPGGDALVIVDSDEHTPDGHLTEDLNVHKLMHDKRMTKQRGLLAEAMMPEVYPSLEHEVLLCWGSTFGPCREAVDILRVKGRSVCLLHFAQVWPLDGEKLRPFLTGRRVISVEGNYSAQFASLLKQAGAISRYETMPRFDGLPFTAEEIARRMPE